MTYGAYLFTIEEVRRAVRLPHKVTDDKLREWIQVANSVSDFWLKAQLAQILGELHPGEAEWGEVVKGWLVQAVERHSWWTDEFVVLVLRAWPQLLLNSGIMLRLIDTHPVGIASGLLEALKRRAIQADQVSDEWLTRIQEKLKDRQEPYREMVGMLLAIRQKEGTPSTPRPRPS